MLVYIILQYKEPGKSCILSYGIIIRDQVRLAYILQYKRPLGKACT